MTRQSLDVEDAGVELGLSHVNRISLRVFARKRFHFEAGRASLNPNPHWPNDPSNWSWDFADRMASVIAEELDTLANEISKQQSDAGQSQQDVTAGIIKILNDMQASQQRWVQELLVQSEATRQSEELRLKVLWWSEAMYSRSLCCGYRELPAPVASVAMALDLVDEVTRKPAPASVGYLLAEAVHRLQGAEFGREYVLLDLLRALEEARNRLPASWFNRLGGLPDEGRISLRDLTLFALAGQRDSGLDKKLAQAGLGADVKLSLPTLARALFRQEQAVQIAGGHR
ncbi:MAG: GTPase-associated system all-helical protein GASH [Nannocystaceae bacterium]